MKSEYFKALLTFLHSSDESLCITFIFILLIAKKKKKNPQYSYRFTNYFFCFIFFSLDIKSLSNVKYPEAFFHNCQTGTTIINWRHGREKVLRDYSFCEIVAFLSIPAALCNSKFLAFNHHENSDSWKMAFSSYILMELSFQLVNIFLKLCLNG